MRDCKEWLGLSKDRELHPRTFSSLILTDVIKKECRGASDIDILNCRYTTMSSNLKCMFTLMELNIRSYQRLKNLLCIEYVIRAEALHNET